MAQQTLKKIYSDIDLSFKRTPGRNDIAISYDEQAVIRAVRYLLLTKKGEKPFEPDFGSRLNALLFEPVDFLTSQAISDEIRTVIRAYEPRVELRSIDVNANPDQNAYNVTLEFFIGNNTQTTTVNLSLERTR